MADKSEVEVKSITPEEKEKILEASKEPAPKKYLPKRAAASKSNSVTKKDFESFKSNFICFRKENDSEMRVIFNKLEALGDDMKMVIDSLNDIVKRVDALEKKEPDDATSVKVDLLRTRIEDMEEDVGDLIDKVDVIFAGSGAEDTDLVSRIEKLERAIYGRLHKRNAEASVTE